MWIPMWISLWVLLLVSSTRYPIGVMLILSSQTIAFFNCDFGTLETFLLFIRLRVHRPCASNEVIFVCQVDNLANGRWIE